MNNVALIGRLTKDIDIRVNANNLTIGRFTLAVNRMKKEDGADFVGCVAFGKTAEILQRYTAKGSQIGIIGRIQTGSYDKDGRTVYTTDIICERVELLGSKKEAQEKPAEPAYMDGFKEMDDDDGSPF